MQPDATVTGSNQQSFKGFETKLLDAVKQFEHTGFPTPDTNNDDI